MIHAPESFLQFGRSSIETVLTLADITLQSTERLVDLQLKTAKEALEQSMRNVRAVSAAKDLAELVAIQTQATRPDLEHALAYSRDVYPVAADAQARLGDILNSRASELGGDFLTVIDEAAKAPSLGAEMAPVKAVLTHARRANDAQSRPANHTKKVTASTRKGNKRTAPKKKAR